MRVDHLIELGVPFDPLTSWRSKWFSMDFLNALADIKRPGTRFAGVCYENSERADIKLEVPKSGYEIQEDQLFWDFPNGVCKQCSPKELRDMHDYEFTKEDTTEAYEDIADQMKYRALGIPTDEKADIIEQFKEDLGTLASENWKKYEWRKPDKDIDTVSCFTCVNRIWPVEL